MQYLIRDHLRENIESINRRVYMLRAPEGAGTPFVVMQRISRPRAVFSTRVSRFQFACYHEQYGHASLTAEYVTEAIQELESQHTRIIANYPEDERESYEDETSLFRVAVDAMIYEYIGGEEHE